MQIYSDSEKIKIERLKHSTRVKLEMGYEVDGEEFELMLKEEAEQEKMDLLESIDKNIIELNRMIYEILKNAKVKNL